MASATKLDRLEREVGELVEARDTGLSLDHLSEFEDDPVGFIREILHDAEPGPWDKQVEIAEAVRDDPQVVVYSANAVGKDWLAARLALWHVYARRGTVLVTGPTERQVREIVFGEIRAAFRQTKLPGRLFSTALRIEGEDDAGILGFTSSEASRLTGFHAPRLLAIATEAQGLEPFAWEALFACTTGQNDKVLALGNPERPEGTFYSVARAADWTSIRIEASDHPNVREGREIIPGGISPRFVQQIASRYGRESSIYATRVLGRFPDSAEDALVQAAWVEDSVAAHESGAWTRTSRGEEIVCAVDVARYGDDASVFLVRQGRRVRKVVTWHQADTMETTGRVIHELATLDGELGMSVVIDEVGLGSGVLDRLAEERKQNPRVRELIGTLDGFHGGKRARKPRRFANKRAEALFGLRRRFEKGEIAVPDHPQLKEELTRTLWTVDSSGRIKIESKDDIRSRIGRSPDVADALAMAFYRVRRAHGGALVPM